MDKLFRLKNIEPNPLMQALSTKAWNFAKNVLWGLPCAIIFAVLLTAAPTWLFTDLSHAEWFWGYPRNSYVFTESKDGDFPYFCWNNIFFDLIFWTLFFALAGLAVRWVFRKFGFTIRPFYSVCIMGALIGALYVYFFRPDQLINLETGGYLGFLETPSEQMHLAMWPGDAEKVLTLVEKHPDLVFSKSITGDTPLDEAAYYGDTAIVKLLLANKADIEAKEMHGETPLFGSAMNGYVGATELLLNSGAEVNVKDDNGDTPLLRAAESRSCGVVKLLLENKADVNAKNNYEGYSPLHEAATHGSRGIVQLLIASNAEINAEDKEGETPLYLAVQNGHKDVVALLLTNKADVNVGDKYGTTPLRLAANLIRNPPEDSNGQAYQDIAELLQQHGATNN